MTGDQSKADEISLNYTRQTNVLIDGKRNEVMASLKELKTMLIDIQVSFDSKRLFLENKLMQALALAVSNPSDSVREEALTLLDICSEQFRMAGSEPQESLQELVVGSVLSRLNTYPYLETVEEIRMKLLCFCIKHVSFYKTGFVKKINELVDCFVNSLNDNCPENKKTSCQLIKSNLIEIGSVLSLNSKRVLVALVKNLGHSHWKVRKEVIETIGCYFVYLNNGEHLKDVVESISVLNSDKNLEVRKAYILSVKNMLLSIGLSDLKDNESKLILELLYFSNEEKELQSLSEEALQEFAKRRHELFVKFNQ